MSVIAISIPIYSATRPFDLYAIYPLILSQHIIKNVNVLSIYNMYKMKNVSNTLLKNNKTDLNNIFNVISYLMEKKKKERMIIWIMMQFNSIVDRYGMLLLNIIIINSEKYFSVLQHGLIVISSRNNKARWRFSP